MFQNNLIIIILFRIYVFTRKKMIMAKSEVSGVNRSFTTVFFVLSVCMWLMPLTVILPANISHIHTLRLLLTVKSISILMCSCGQSSYKRFMNKNNLLYNTVVKETIVNRQAIATYCHHLSGKTNKLAHILDMFLPLS